MATGTLLARPIVRWAAIFVAWGLLSLFLAPEVYIYFLYKREPIPWSETLALTFANTAIAAAFTPGIVWLTRRFPMERRRWLRSLLAHVPACIVFSFTHAWLYSIACYASPYLSYTLLLRFHPNMLTYGAIAGITIAIDYFEKYQERERQLARAQLQLLRLQLHPHFLFNTLHTISAMMHEDVKAADRMVSRLSDLLRLTLDSIGQNEVPLRQEIEFVEKYVEIERIRFQDGIELSVDVDPAALDAMVPSMLLQPLVENSIRHGFRGRKTAGVVQVRVRSAGERLNLDITDNGDGLPRAGLREGVGLSNTRRRLEQLYASAHSFEIGDSEWGGARVRIAIPLTRAAMPEGGRTVEMVGDESTGADRGRRALGEEADSCASEG